MSLVRVQAVALTATALVTFCVARTAAQAASATAPATNTAAADAEIDALLKQLGSDDWPTRMAAQNRLAAMGEAAEPRLKRAARESDDAEVRARCEAALHQIADNRLAGPTLITMRVHDVHPRIVFQELERQSGVELKPQTPSLWTQPLPSVTLDVTGEPLWDVLRRVRQQCGLDVEPWNNGVAVMRAAGGGADKPPTLTHGPFRIRATRISRSYAVDLASGGVAVNEFVVALSLQAEPKLRISSAAPLARVDTAEDENGLSLLPGAAGAGAAAAAAAAAEAPPVRAARVVTDFSGRGGASAWVVTARLEYPPQGAGKRIARLKGATTCNLIVRMETLEVPDILKADGLTREVGGSEVTIRSCRKVGERYDLVLSMSSEAFARAGPQAVAFRAIRGGNQSAIRLVDTTGRDMTQQGTTRMVSNNDRFDVTLSFAAGGPGPVAASVPSKLIWQVPTEVREVQVPFEFTDLPLP